MRFVLLLCIEHVMCNIGFPRMYLCYVFGNGDEICWSLGELVLQELTFLVILLQLVN